MPIVQYVYFHLLSLLKESDNFIIDVAATSGFWLFERISKRDKILVFVCSVPEGKQNLLYTYLMTYHMHI